MHRAAGKIHREHAAEGMADDRRAAYAEAVEQIFVFRARGSKR